MYIGLWLLLAGIVSVMHAPDRFPVWPPSRQEEVELQIGHAALEV